MQNEPNWPEPMVQNEANSRWRRVEQGLRDFSVIATAPQKRLSIKTFVSRSSDGLIREAVLRELKRGGQVYYVHNEVETIENSAARPGISASPNTKVRTGINKSYAVAPITVLS